MLRSRNESSKGQSNPKARCLRYSGACFSRYRLAREIRLTFLDIINSSAVQPLLVSNEPRPKDGNLLNKLTHAARSSSREIKSSPLRNHQRPLEPLGEDAEEMPPPHRQRELDGQKARIVADLAKDFPETAGRSDPTADKYGRRTATASSHSGGKENDGGRSIQPSHAKPLCRSSAQLDDGTSKLPSEVPSQKIAGGVFDVFSKNLCEAFESRDAGRPSETDRESATRPGDPLCSPCL